MVQNAWISICGTQDIGSGEPHQLELVTEGSYCYEPGYAKITYEETEVTGLEGVITSFTVEDGCRVTLSRTGKLNSSMTFIRGERHESLYDAGFAVLMVSVKTRSMTVLLNENGGVLDLEYEVEIEHEYCGTNSYHIQIRTN